MAVDDLSDLGSFGYGLDATMQDRCPEFVAAYAGMVAAARSHAELSPLMQELIGLAVNASPTHLNQPAVGAHIAGALAEGGTEEVIVEVLQLVSCLGIHAIVHAVPKLVALADDLTLNGDERRTALKRSWTDRRGFWP